MRFYLTFMNDGMLCYVSLWRLGGYQLFRSAGIENEDTLLQATIGVGVVKVLFILVAVLGVDRMGRRTILMASGLGIGKPSVKHWEGCTLLPSN